eukprot:m51a1_g454 hypothetical protein (556) ;mRNA; r:144948-147209
MDWEYKRAVPSGAGAVPGPGQWLRFDAASSKRLTECFESLKNADGHETVALGGGEANVLKMWYRDRDGTVCDLRIKWRDNVLYVVPDPSAPTLFSPEELDLLVGGDPQAPPLCVWLWWSGDWSEFSSHAKRTQDPKWRFFEDAEMAKLEEGFKRWKQQGPSVMQINGMHNIDYAKGVQFKHDCPSRERPVRRELVRWLWQDDTGRWRSYMVSYMLQIERAFMSREPQVLLRIQNVQYEVNLVEMVQYRHEHKFYRRNIRRVGPPLSAEHTKGVKLGSELLLFNETMPAYWTPGFGEGQDQFRTVDIALDSWEATNIESLLNGTIVSHKRKYGVVPGTQQDPKRFEVKRITRVQDKQMWDKYITAKRRVCQKWHMEVQELESSAYIRARPFVVPMLDANANEFWFWHGCKYSPLIDEMILTGKGGFDNRKACPTGMFGGGLYFAENSSKSNQYVPCAVCQGGTMAKDSPPCSCPAGVVQKPQAMLLCRVTLGNFYISKSDSKFVQLGKYDPPRMSDTGISYDSVLGESSTFAGTELNYREVIVYDQYVVYYLRHGE